MIKKNILFVVFSCCLLTILISGVAKITSNGSPIGVTGAPNEETCGKIGCHNGTNNINTGIGILNIVIANDSGVYQAGEVYEITVTMSENDCKRFGFSLIALNQNNLLAGNLMVQDELRTQILNGALANEGKKYMTYKSEGTNPYSTGLGKWTFLWQAPDKNEGKITFYAAAVSANNDGTDSGDLVYTKSTSMEGKALAINEINFSDELSIFPNPIHDFFYLRLSNTENQIITVTLNDLGGRNITLFEGMSSPSICIQKPNVPTGIYFLKVIRGTKSIQKKIIIR